MQESAIRMAGATSDIAHLWRLMRQGTTGEPAGKGSFPRGVSRREEAEALERKTAESEGLTRRRS